MAIPTHYQIMRPLLELAARQDITRRSVELAMGDHFHLTEEEMALRVPSGQHGLVKDRAGWAMTYLTKAGMLAKIAPKTYRATESGLAFLRDHTGNISRGDLLEIDTFREFKLGSRETTRNGTAGRARRISDDDAQTPGEVIGDAVETLHSDVRQRLLDAILAQDPEFFEHLVLDVLSKMGYGDLRRDAVVHTGKSGDEGIDGRINQDALGLDQVLVQAKRFASDQVVSRKEIQAFIGSLAGQGVTKGVFITTSSFAASAQEFVQRGSQTKVVLIDGRTLLDLMMRYKVGVRVERTVEVLDIDQNYFSDE